MNDIVLRPYQREFIDNVRDQFLHRKKRVVGVAPCGAGKTIMTGWMIKESLARNKRSIFFVHRQELIKQTSETFTRLDIPHGIIAADAPMNLTLPVQIASVQTLARRIENASIPVPDFLICDECHHILAKTYKKVLDAFPDAYLLGVTATPERMGGVTLCDVFESMVESLSVNELIQLGNLTKFQYFAPETNVDLNNIRITHGDFDKKELSKTFNNKKIIGNIVETYKKIADNRSAICYCVDVQHSQNVAEAFQRAGIPAAHCDGETATDKRQAIIEDFRRGNIKILCNVELFGEGFDVPNMQAVILARPTQSLSLYIQQALRPLRPDPNDPNKVAIIIDHVENYRRHGLPNTHHDWTLIPNDKLVKCPHCGKLVNYIVNENTGKRYCPECKREILKQQGGGYRPRNKKNVTGDITEIDVQFNTQPESANTVIKNRPTTPEDFFAIAQQKGYKIGWVAFSACRYATKKEDFEHIAEVCGYKPYWAHRRFQEFRDREHLKKSRSW